jgi:chromosome segregation ATPase
MESRLLQVRQTLTNLKNNTQNLTATGSSLLAQRDRIQDRFATLQTALADTRTLLAGATQAVDALVASADKSGQVIERQLASQTVADLQQLAAQLQRYSGNIEQTRRQIDLEHTLFKGLQTRPATIAADITAAQAELKTTTTQIAGQRASIDALLARLTKDRATLSTNYNTFGQTVENFRVAQVSVLRRWLLDGPPAGDLPSLTVDDVLENVFAPPSEISSWSVDAANGSQLYTLNPSVAGGMSKTGSVYAAPASAALGGKLAIDMNQITPETIRNHNRAKWYLTMLNRLVSFAAESQNEATTWLGATNHWRAQLTDITTTLAQQRGALATLQLEQDTIAATVTLIGSQADTTGAEIATTAATIAAQTTTLQSIIADLKKRSAD